MPNFRSVLRSKGGAAAFSSDMFIRCPAVLWEGQMNEHHVRQRPPSPPSHPTLISALVRVARCLPSAPEKGSWRGRQLSERNVNRRHPGSKTTQVCSGEVCGQWVKGQGHCPQNSGRYALRVHRQHAFPPARLLRSALTFQVDVHRVLQPLWDPHDQAGAFIQR